MADGVSAMRILSQVLWEIEDASDPARVPVTKGTAGGTQETPAPSAGPGASSRAEAARGRLSSLRRIPGTLLRELRPGGETPLDRHIGSNREVAWTSFPLAEMKRIEHAAGSAITVNDVVLAAVSGALRGWLPRGDSDQTLRVQVPGQPGLVPLRRPAARRAGRALGASPDRLRDARAQARPRRRDPVRLLPRPRPLSPPLPGCHPPAERAARVRTLGLERAGSAAARKCARSPPAALLVVRGAGRPPRSARRRRLARWRDELRPLLGSRRDRGTRQAGRRPGRVTGGALPSRLRKGEERRGLSPRRSSDPYLGGAVSRVGGLPHRPCP
jgi:hypothetical protein